MGLAPGRWRLTQQPPLWGHEWAVLLSGQLHVCVQVLGCGLTQLQLSFYAVWARDLLVWVASPLCCVVSR